ncbi:hypothetical protein EV178_006030 [Coemansia sp. RSA 1646]|nr:hypothetical protein EV178_006030 [Coemansia sp. RSA 1646]
MSYHVEPPAGTHVQLSDVPLGDWYPFFMQWQVPVFVSAVYTVLSFYFSPESSKLSRVEAKRQNASSDGSTTKKKVLTPMTMLVVIHNTVLAIYSAWAFRGVFPLFVNNMIKKGFFEGMCDTDGTVWNSALFVHLYLFYLSKYYELLDTVIIILKGRKASILQIYHHAGVILVMYTSNYFTSPCSVFVVWENAGVHTIMYSYYALTALGFNPPGKQYLTSLQIFQFLFGQAVVPVFVSAVYTVLSFYFSPESSKLSRVEAKRQNASSDGSITKKKVLTPMTMLVVVHNTVLAIYSAWAFRGVFPLFVNNMIKKGFSEGMCDTDGTVWNSALFVHLYLFYLSKYYELLDTVIIILKGRKASILQIYHHAGVILVTYITNYYSSGSGLFLVWENTGVHTIMYSYYALTALGFNPPGKRYLTSLQIFQFLFGLTVIVVYFVIPGCQTQNQNKESLDMPLYELVCISRSGLTQKSLEGLLRKSAETVLDRGGAIRGFVNMGRDQPLPYRMKRHMEYHTRGTYWLMHYYTNPKTSELLKNQLKVDTRVVRCNVVKMTDRLKYMINISDAV